MPAIRHVSKKGETDQTVNVRVLDQVLDCPAHDEVSRSCVRTEVPRSGNRYMINRTKGLVLAVFGAYWLIVVVVLVTTRDVYD